MIRLIASDLDGTIIDSHNHCDPRIPQILNHYRGLGAAFAVCSGRPLDSVLPLLDGWNLKDVSDYIVGSNGGEVLEVSTGVKKTAYTLSAELVREVIDVYEPLHLVSTLYDGMTLYVSRINDNTETVAQRVGVDCIQGDIRALTKEPQFKLMFIVNPEDMDIVEQFAKDHPDPRYTGYRTAADLFEITHPKLAKDVGIQMIEELMHISPEEILAFGDTSNDVEMLKHVKYGVVMENGTDDAKEAAYALTSSVNDCGVGEYLRRHLSDALEIID